MAKELSYYSVISDRKGGAGDWRYASISSVLLDPRPNLQPRSLLPSLDHGLLILFIGKYLLIVDCITRHYSRNWGRSTEEHR